MGVNGDSRLCNVVVWEEGMGSVDALKRLYKTIRTVKIIGHRNINFN